MSNTIQYYDANANEFIENTLSADMSETQNLFLSYISTGKNILDLGCGSGRDSKAFLEKGYNVTAVDGSPELCRRATELLDQEVLNLKFEEIDFDNKFDGIWACASLLHVPNNDLVNVFRRIKKSLKLGGVLYCSFKYGTFEGERNGRYFTDMNEESFSHLIEELDCMKIEKVLITSDVRKDRAKEKWLNVIVTRECNERSL